MKTNGKFRGILRKSWKTITTNIVAIVERVRDSYRGMRENEVARRIFTNTGYFIRNFRLQLVALAAIFVLLRLGIVYHRRFDSNELTRYVKASKHAGNAVFINKSFLITNYKSINATCKLSNKREKVRVFIIFDGEAFPVDIVDSNEVLGLTLLKIDPKEKKYVNVNNFVLFPNNFLFLPY
jgi:hypothetical protein